MGARGLGRGLGNAADFNQTPGNPAINWGKSSTSNYATILGSEPKSNVYGVSADRLAPLTKFSGTTAESFSTSTGPYGAIKVCNSRELIFSQTNETFNNRNAVTVPYVSSNGGFITPEESNASHLLQTIPYSYWVDVR